MMRLSLFTITLGILLCQTAPALAASPGTLAAVNSAACATPDSEKSAFEIHAKNWIREHVAEPLVRAYAESDPVFVWAAGWDFDAGCWKLNEFTNQTTHMLIGGALNQLIGRHFTFCLATGIELGQYFGRDHRDLKLPDRVRDVCFYLLPA